MLFDSIKFIEEQLNNFVQHAQPGLVVKLGNIARLNDGDEFVAGELENAIVISLVNITEDKTVKKVENFRRENNQVIYHPPPVLLNLHLLFSATHSVYANALQSLEHIVRFFQSTPVISVEKSNALKAYNLLHHTAIEKLSFEIVNLPLEQLHQLWGGLGGHYMPSVLYLLRLVEIDSEGGEPGTPIREIKMDFWPEN